MADSDGDSDDDIRSRKRPKKTSTVSAAVARSSDEERAAQMTPAQILALLEQVKWEQEKNKKLETNLAKAQRKLKETAKTNARLSMGSRARISVSSSAVIPITTTKAKKLPDLSRQGKERVLKRISFGEDAEDKHKTTNARGLQVLIWRLGCNYCLQKHQFLGVRAAAGGMLDEIPGHLDLDRSPQKIMETLKRAHLSISDRGVIIADVMGLGKTVEAVIGAILRNAIAEVKERPKKPTLICSPNKAVLAQWHQTLIKAGVDKKKIYRFRTKTSKPLAEDDIFVLCTMYDLLTELRYCFYYMKRDAGSTYAPMSPLFASAPVKLLWVLRNQYRAEKGRETNQYNKNGQGETVNECIRRHLGKQGSNCKLTFRTVILDEAHFLRNLKTYWGMAAALIGLHSERMIPMSGTPFNNTLQDMATLMTFIDPSHSSATFKWWKDNTNNGEARQVVESIKEWSNEFLIRRGKDVLAGQLPPKAVTTKRIAPSKTDLAVYDTYEVRVLSILKRLQKLREKAGGSPSDQKELNECLRKFMALAANAMLALDHPVLPGGGRDLSIFFSPSRCRMESAIKKQEKRTTCVSCKRKVRLKLKRNQDNEPYMELLEEKDDTEDLLDPHDEVEPEVVHKHGSEAECENEEWEEEEEEAQSDADHELNDEDSVVKENSDEEYEDVEEEHSDDDAMDENEYEDEEDEPSDDEMSMDQYSDEEDSEEEEMEGDEKEEKGRGAIVPIPPDLCQTAELGIKHFACESCLEKLKECPRCGALIPRLQTATCQKSMVVKEDHSGKVDIDNDKPSERTYSTEVFGGFQASPKLNAVLSSFAKVPVGEKALIVSFFKGSLDLLEAMLSETFPSMEVARFDGDVAIDEREKVLEKFRTEEACRVLLMTVQTGGVGLNLVEANHVLFLERYWNPMVLEQCEDRCYRIGQTKKVTVVYHEAENTIDNVMAIINKSKASNAGIILADGPALRANPSFKETTGLFGKGILEVKGAREAAQDTTPKTTLHADSAVAEMDDAERHNAATLLPVQESLVRTVAAKNHDPRHNAEKSASESASINENDTNASASLPIQNESSAKSVSATNRDMNPSPDFSESCKSPTPNLATSMLVSSSGDDDECVVVGGVTIKEDECAVVNIRSGVIEKEGEQAPPPGQNRVNGENEKKADSAVIDQCSSDGDDE